MAHIAAPGSFHLNNPPSTNTSHASPHGTKRPAESALENEQRLSKRFGLLNLTSTSSNGTRLYIPVPGSSTTTTTTTTTTHADPVPTPHPLAFTKRPRAPRSARPSPSSDGMQVDDSPHRVYIHDLAAELSDIESDEENPIFLPDIEKHLAKIPQHVLLGGSLKAREDNQVVLYSVPSSLSVGGERDAVRKAIVESRRRIREGQGRGDMMETVSAPGKGPGVVVVVEDKDEDEDAMDLD